MVLSRRFGRRMLAGGLLLVAAGVAGGVAQAAREAQPENKIAPYIEHYRVRAADPGDLRMAAPKLPDLSAYTLAAVQQKVKKNPAGHASIRRMVQEPALHEFVAGRGRMAEWAKRQSRNPEAIFIEGGYMTPRDLARDIPAAHFEEIKPGLFVLRLPLVVARGATFHVDGQTSALRMSVDAGAFLVNDGQLFITETQLLGWREREQAPAKFRKDEEFRPFLIAWGGSQTYVANSLVAHLGYTASKAYGVSLSQYSPHMDARLQRSRPTGWIINSEFYDNWFGFYCYEAEDVVIAGNNYHDNIVYSIDPHDRSRRLIIAGNTASGPLQKHGIIISREVNDSFIFNNRTFGNRLGGIVLDRNSTNNVVAYNESSGNLGDGITIYESPDNVIYGNRVIGNARHGIRLRNSVDIRLYENSIVANKLAGIYGHIKDLAGTDRDLKLDPFELNFSMLVVGGELVFNGSGPITLDRPLSAELYDVELLAPTKSLGIQMRGVLGEYQHEVLDILTRQDKAVVIEPADAAKLQRAARRGKGG